MRISTRAALVLLSTSVSHTVCSAHADTPDFERDIAPMIERCCLSCHQVGGPGAYPFTTAAHVKRVAHTMVQALEVGQMPPWAPNAGVMHVPPMPTREERTMFRAWVEAGAPITRADYALIGAAQDPSRVLREWRIGDTWTIGATERRVMRSFQQPLALEEGTFVGGWRVRFDTPGLLSTVLFTAGDQALAQSLDERDASVGFKFTGDLANAPAGALGGVGAQGVFKLPYGFAFRVKANEAFVAECHADGRGRSEVAAFTVEALAPNITQCAALRVVTPFVIGAQGAARTSATDARVVLEMPPLERALDLACITLRPGTYAERVKVLAWAPGATAARELIRIDRYDIHIDHPYVVDPPVQLAAGTRLVLETEALNEFLAVRSSPQAVLLVTPSLDVARNSSDERVAEAAALPLGEHTKAWLALAVASRSGETQLQCTTLATKEVFRELMNYESEASTDLGTGAGYSWFEAVALANELSRRCGLDAAYRIEFAQRDGARLIGAVVSETGSAGWRLPHANEWRDTFADVALSPKLLWNWNFDQEGTARVIRGGCWADAPSTSGIDAKGAIEPVTRSELFGARFVRSIAPTR